MKPLIVLAAIAVACLSTEAKAASIRLCTGAESGNYFAAGDAVAKMAGKSLSVVNVPTEGTIDNLERVLDLDPSDPQACDAMIGQPDGPVFVGRSSPAKVKKLRQVRVDGEQVITIESDCSLAGINPLGPYEEAVRQAAENLTAFLGRRPPAIEIFDMREGGPNGGKLMGYWAKGHHERYAFAEAVNEYTGADCYHDSRYVTVPRRIGDPEPVRHEWWRSVPISGEPGHNVYHAAEPHSRGAFAVTFTTIVEDRERKIIQRNIDEFHKGSRRGFADGLNWALRQLDIIDDEAGRKLLACYRERDKA